MKSSKDSLLSAVPLLTAQADQRILLLSRAENYGASYEAELSQAQALVDDLLALTSDNPRQRQLLGQIQASLRDLRENLKHEAESPNTKSDKTGTLEQ